MPDNNIGKKGEVLNLSLASRAMNIEPDADQIEQYDEYEAKSNPSQFIVLFAAILNLGFTSYLFYNGSWIFAFFTLLLTLFLFMLSRSLGKATLMKQVAYKDGLIIPAIVSSTEPLEIIALADMCSSSNQEKVVYGCLKKKINQLPNHTIKLNEKIPCVSLFGMAIKGYRRHFEPRPISWGFKNANYIDEVVNFITKDNEGLSFENEWIMLENLAPKMKGKNNDEVVFFDENLNKIEL